MIYRNDPLGAPGTRLRIAIAFRILTVGTGACKTRNGEMAKWRNGTKDKSQSCKITVPLKLKLPFHWNIHLLPNLFYRLIPTNERNIYNHKSLGNLGSSLSLLTERGLTRLGYSWIKWRRLVLTSEENDLFISYLPSSSGYDVMLSAPAITWNGLSKPNPRRDEVYTRYLANMYFAQKRSDLGYVYQIDTG